MDETNPNRNTGRASHRFAFLTPFFAIMVSGLIVAGALLYVNSGEGEVRSTSQEGDVASFQRVDGNIAGEGDDPVLGEADAPVTLVVFGDFQCHFCKQFATEVKPVLVERYVKTGKARIIFRDFPFSGPPSVLAAEAASCAMEQESYWAYAEKLHEVQTGHDPAVFSKDNLTKLAGNLSLDLNEFNQCLDSGKYTQEAHGDHTAGMNMGVRGTPTVFINGIMIVGAQPFEVYEEIIEDELARNL